MSARSRICVCLAASLTALALAGCGMNNASLTTTAGTPGTSTAKLGGIARGGAKPIANGHLYLYEASYTGYETQAISRFAASPGTNGGSATTKDTADSNYYINTGGDGSFTLGSNYTCTEGHQMYLVSTGGNPGLSNPDAVNSSITLLAAIGPCPASGSQFAVPSIVINEMTTVATAYAFAGFLQSTGSATDLSTSNTAAGATALNNAYANFQNLVDITQGAARTTTLAGNGNVPYETLNTLANILESCVNSAGANPTGQTNCDKLSSATGASNTATAAINIASLQLSVDTAKLLPLQVASTEAFQPALQGQPTNLTVAITYPAAKIGDSIKAVAIDSTGNVWLMPTTDDAQVFRLNSAGVSDGLSHPTQETDATHVPNAIAVDNTDSLYYFLAASDGSSADLAYITPTGTGAYFESEAGFGNGTVYSVSVDNTGDYAISAFFPPGGFATGYGSAEFDMGGASSSAIRPTATQPVAMELYSSGDQVRIFTDGSTLTNSNDQFPTPSLSSVVDVKFTSSTTMDYLDPSGNMANCLFNASEHAGDCSTLTGITGSGYDHLSVDSQGDAFLSSASTGNIASYNFTGRGQANIITAPAGVTSTEPAPDGSLWVADGDVLQFIGLAYPTKTPRMNSNFGVAP